MQKKLEDNKILRWIDLAKFVAGWSKDPITKVGAVILPPNSDIPIIGWNGFPRKIKDFPERYADRETKYGLIVHAETNAILNSAKHGISLEGATLFCTMFPCEDCAKNIIQAGIKTVYSLPMDKERLLRWNDSIKKSQSMFIEASVDFFICTK